MVYPVQIFTQPLPWGMSLRINRTKQKQPNTAACMDSLYSPQVPKLAPQTHRCCSELPKGSFIDPSELSKAAELTSPPHTNETRRSPVTLPRSHSH